ncbi:MAG: peptide chain release factor aRF-1 [Candidatus Methanofastidiosia archaeon]
MQTTQTYKFKKILEELSSHRGRHTELVSLYIPQGYEISKITSQLREELGTASNIKSTSTRKNVTSALEKVLQHLTLYKKLPENGLVIFCGNISEREGNPDITLFSIEPIKPLTIKLYRCNQEFVLDPLYEMLGVKEVYGLIIIERNEATLGSLQGTRIVMEDSLTSGAPGKIRAGGQSAQRFARLREIADHEFKKRVGEHATRLFLERENLSGILVGGPGYVKEKFISGDFLHHELRKKVIGVLDISYNGEFGLRELVERAKDLLSKLDYTRERELVQEFLKRLVRDEAVAYGEREVRRALELGAVDTLLLSEGLSLKRVKISCDACGLTKLKTAKESELRDLEEKKCPKCGNLRLSIKESLDLLEELTELAQKTSTNVEIISKETEEGTQLLKAFGGIAAILRFRIEG